MQTTLCDARRHEYLQVLGIPQFIARRPLLGAAPSLEPVAAVVVVVPTLVAAPAPAPAPVAVAVAVADAHRKLLTSALVPRSNPDADSTTASTAASTAISSLPILRFTCRLVQVSDGLVVLLDLGEYPDLDGPERQLWQAICRAFGWTSRQLATDFSWPLLAGSMIGSDLDAAREVIDGWLRRDLSADQRLLVLGDVLEPVIRRAHRVLPSLSELLAKPLAKRQLWQQLAHEFPLNNNAGEA